VECARTLFLLKREGSQLSVRTVKHPFLNSFRLAISLASHCLAFSHQATSIWTLHTSASSFVEFLCSSASPVIAMHTGALLSGKLFTSPTAPSIISVQNVGSTGVYWRTRYADVFLWVSGNHCTAVWDSSRPAWRLALHMYL
jgi:hypothetical protein